MKINCKDNVIEVEEGASGFDLAKKIGMGLYKAACAMRVNGEVRDLRTALAEGDVVEILTF
ncbi:TGS domain-containing protein, partial [Akkermansia muciniphila]|uniref:TGS domain-containing protein n=1 Tax=Akkermansia muciniphila TaxID=239935 RepID=UPI00122F3402